MVTVSLLSSFSVSVEASRIVVSFCTGLQMSFAAEHVQDLLSGRVIGTLYGTMCLTGSRLVTAGDGDCEIMLFPPALIGEFVSQLDSVESVPPHAPGGG